MDNDPAPQYPGKRLPEVRLLVTTLLWREVSLGINLPWGTHPRPLLKDSHPWAAGVGLGAAGTCTPTAPSHFPPQLTPSLQRKPCSGQADCSHPSAPTCAPRPHSSPLGSLVLLDQHSVHQQDWCYPPWDLQLLVSASREELRGCICTSPQIDQVRCLQWGPRRIGR